MIARYHPDVPELCDNAEFVIWQFSSTSYVRGIRGHVDRSCMMNHYTVNDILMR
jgi:GH25 family lysozyme M1 (1,4-beta-N-acetylmuramidase)